VYPMHEERPKEVHDAIAGAVLSFARAIGEFGATLMLGAIFRARRIPCRLPSTALQVEAMDQSSYHGYPAHHNVGCISVSCEHALEAGHINGSEILR
jgi:ABC-type sulfate transport system permease subunit